MITKDRLQHLYREDHDAYENINRVADQRDGIGKGTVMYVGKIEEDRRNGYLDLILKS